MATGRPKQLRFDASAFLAEKAFGGSLLKKSHAKSKRPVSTRLPMHVVLRSSKARGRRSMLAPAHARKVNAIVRGDARKFGVRVLEFANVGNHMHLLVRAGNRWAFLYFLRSISGRIAMELTGARKGLGLWTKDDGAKDPFWDKRPFTRVVEGRRGYRAASDYVMLNQLEAAGVIPVRRKRTASG